VIFGAGCAFFALSLLITRRSFARRRILAHPAVPLSEISRPAPTTKPHVSPALEAFEALNIATINVLSLATLSTGAALWYLDINSMEDARRKLRGGLGVDGTGRDEKQAEEEFEEWMASVLSRKEGREKGRREGGEGGERERERERFRNERGKER
jgi:hypothetical protein